MSLGFYSKSEAYLISLCPDGIGRTWDRTDLGSDGHGIPYGIDVTFRGIPSGRGCTQEFPATQLKKGKTLPIPPLIAFRFPHVTTTSTTFAVLLRILFILLTYPHV